jgi:hypothetical protein
LQPVKKRGSRQTPFNQKLNNQKLNNGVHSPPSSALRRLMSSKSGIVPPRATILLANFLLCLNLGFQSATEERRGVLHAPSIPRALCTVKDTTISWMPEAVTTATEYLQRPLPIWGGEQQLNMASVYSGYGRVDSESVRGATNQIIQIVVIQIVII